MPEQIQALLNRILEWWRKFTRRQQVLIVSISAVVIVSFIILAVIITRPTMVKLIDCEDGVQANAVKELLTENDIPYETSQDGFTFFINEKDEADANILLGSNSIPSSGYSINDAVDGSFSTTEADKQKKYKLYLESKFEDTITSLSMVTDADVTLNIPDEDGTLISHAEPGYATVVVGLSSPMTSNTAAGIAKYMSVNLGNDDTENIMIMDRDGNVLFAGGDANSAAGNASANQDVRDRARKEIAERVENVLDGTNLYDEPLSSAPIKGAIASAGAPSGETIVYSSTLAFVSDLHANANTVVSTNSTTNSDIKTFFIYKTSMLVKALFT